MASPAPLFPKQRQERIVVFLQRHGAVTLQQMAQALEVSISTLRRDLDALEEEGVLSRTHGGALLRQQPYSTFEPDAAAAAELSPREKRAIGVTAAAALVPGQSVLFDSGSTVLEAARAAVERLIPLIAVTNDLAIAQALGLSEHIKVHMLGGYLRRNSNTLYGDEVIERARHFRVDVLFLGAHAVSDGEVSETMPEVAAVKRAFLLAATSRRLLVDSSKFREPALMRVCSVRDLHEVVCDEAPPDRELSIFQEAGVKFTTASNTP